MSSVPFLKTSERLTVLVYVPSITIFVVVDIHWVVDVENKM